MTFYILTTQCRRSVVYVLVVRVDIHVGVVPQRRRSVVQVLIVRVDTGVVIYESMIPQCGRSVVSGSGAGCQSRYRSDDQ